MIQKGNKGIVKGEDKKKNSWECHTGNPLVFTSHDGIEVYGGGSSRKGGWWLMDPVPDLAMGPDEQVHKGLPSKFSTRGLDSKKWSCMSKIVQCEPKEILAIDFPDYKVPQDIGKAFWLELVENIRENKIKTIHCMCMGGHGRTGVQLAILRYLLATEEERKEWKDAHELVMDIRKPYCDKAVEANAQQEYVAEVCGIEKGALLPFHKGYASTTTYSKSSVKKTNWNTKLVECSICDFVSWENTADNVVVAEFCYDDACMGKLIDITDLAIERDKPERANGSCLCLSCLQPVSEIMPRSITHLSPNLMEMIHGKEWEKLMVSQTKLNGPGTLKGKLLRALSSALRPKTLKELGDDVVVVDSCILCNFKMSHTDDSPDYEQGERGFVKHVKCDFCAAKLTPFKLTMARATETGEQKKCCPECINESKHGFWFKNTLYKSDGILVAGVSPQAWYQMYNRASYTVFDISKMPKIEPTVEVEVVEDSVINEGSGDYDEYNIV